MPNLVPRDDLRDCVSRRLTTKLTMIGTLLGLFQSPASSLCSRSLCLLSLLFLIFPIFPTFLTFLMSSLLRLLQGPPHLVPITLMQPLRWTPIPPRAMLTHPLSLAAPDELPTVMTAAPSGQGPLRGSQLECLLARSLRERFYFDASCDVASDAPLWHWWGSRTKGFMVRRSEIEPRPS